MFQHFLHVPIRHQETNIVTFDRGPPEYDETLCTHHQEPRKLVGQDLFQFVGLFDLDRESHTVDRGFDQNFFGRVAGDR